MEPDFVHPALATEADAFASPRVVTPVHTYWFQPTRYLRGVPPFPWYDLCGQPAS